jgi:small subunit ribosomal protein MRP21
VAGMHRGGVPCTRSVGMLLYQYHLLYRHGEQWLANHKLPSFSNAYELIGFIIPMAKRAPCLDNVLSSPPGYTYTYITRWVFRFSPPPGRTGSTFVLVPTLVISFSLSTPVPPTLCTLAMLSRGLRSQIMPLAPRWIRYTASSSSVSSPIPGPSTPPTPSRSSRLVLPDLPPRSESLEWWQSASRAQNGLLGNQYSGRSVPVPRQADFMGMYRRLQGVMSRSGVRRDLRLGEFHEKRSDKRRRVESERHRRRFQEMVSARARARASASARSLVNDRC